MNPNARLTHIRIDKGGVLYRVYPFHAASTSLPSLPYASHSGSIDRRFMSGLDIPNLKKRGSETHSWVRIEAVTASV
jgi:hypothetical protein